MSAMTVDARLHSESAEDVAQWLYANGHHDAAATVRNQLDVRNERIRELETARADRVEKVREVISGLRQEASVLSCFTESFDYLHELADKLAAAIGGAK